MNDWIPWHGGRQPVDDDVMVEARGRSGLVYSLQAYALEWTHGKGPDDFDDIIAYRVAENQP